MKYDDFLKYLDSLRPSQFRMELEPIIEAAREMGQPHLKFPTIHIAGTNGKGSTAAFLNSILRSNGLKVGVYTSPHLVDVRERIVLDGNLISKGDMVAIAEDVLSILSSPNQLSYFEFLTLVAFEYFARNKVDIAVVETGLGGRLDATNIVKAVISVITSISFDHQKHLGATLAQIAKEKCGIIKRGSYTITCEQEPEVLEVIRRSCDDAGSPLIIVEPLPPHIKLGLIGDHQRQNAALAVEAVRTLPDIGITVTDPMAGLDKAVWPGRLETVNLYPKVILDGAHNAAGAEALARYISQTVPRSDAILVLGALADKDIPAICRTLAPVVKEVICVSLHSDRAASPKDVAAVARSYGAKVRVAGNIDSTLKELLSKVSKSDTVFVTGSLTTVGEAKMYFGLHGENKGALS